jgi:aerobic-type carbon monoxide dehydrogenase small subunit (CoxS/CutS family)
MNKVKINVNVNGEMIEKEVEPKTLLVHFLREELGLTGTHEGCDTSNCGACTVVVDGKAVKSCTTFAVQADGKSVTTVEGLSRDGKLHAIQKSFVEKHGLQCGFCTSGMIMTSYWLLNRKKNPTEKEIREAISGNLCRCTGYDSVIDAIRLSAKKMHEEEEELREVAVVQ